MAVELEYGETPGNFDTIIVNDTIENAYQSLREFLLPQLEAMEWKIYTQWCSILCQNIYT